MATPRIGKKVFEEAAIKQADDFDIGPQTASAQVFVSPEIAARSLVRYLPEDVQMFIAEAADKMQVPVWHLLLGYAMKCADRFELFSPYLLSAWTSGGIPNSARACKTCGLEFISRYADASYCCNYCACGKHTHNDTCPTKTQERVTT